MPVSGCSTETIQGFLKKPQFARLRKGAVRRWANHNTFSRREGSLTEYIFYIALLKRAAMVDCQGDDEAKMDVGDDGGVAVGGGPWSGITVTEDDDT